MCFLRTRVWGLIHLFSTVSSELLAYRLVRHTWWCPKSYRPDLSNTFWPKDHIFSLQVSVQREGTTFINTDIFRYALRFSRIECYFETMKESSSLVEAALKYRWYLTQHCENSSRVALSHSSKTKAKGIFLICRQLFLKQRLSFSCSLKKIWLSRTYISTENIGWLLIRMMSKNFEIASI